ncbi:MAG: 4-hydroxybenzoate 3-monooxygenase [Actinobacteria bacterium]|nr:MAG: 4-hydroxybenzoate 3-monooxygenase [Actinomycetota bacterium]
MSATQVGIVGAGPAGLVLAHLLQRCGIESVVLELHDREYVEARVRAGVLEQGTADLLNRIGVGERMRSDGSVHRGVNLQFLGRRHRIALDELTGGKAITVYGQQEVVKDLIAARLAAGGEVRFGVENVRLEGVETDAPVVHYRHDGQERALRCDVVAGCDGFHGCCRDAVPHARTFEREHPFAWLGILAAVAPSTEELIYAYHDRGFALHSLRSPELSRLYLQVDPHDRIESWPDERIWEELQLRLASEGWVLREGPVLEKGITALRSFVVEPMQHRRLFLAGDAAHIVPATGAKGMNLAVADVVVLAQALDVWYRTGRDDGLRAYSATCLRRVWRVQDFSVWMTMLMHRHGDAFTRRVQEAAQAHVCESVSAARCLAESYVGGATL